MPARWRLRQAAVAELFRGEPQTRIRVEASPDVPLVRGDGPQLQRVVVNVVENALKFSGGDHDVEVKIAPRGDVVEVAVHDHGPGIAAEDADRIFEPFARGGRTRDVPGSGLGLAIARGLAVANGGALRLSAEAGGRGSTFVLERPAARDAADA
jgi:two-component system sensor histidine kinase KdpD